MNLLKYLSTLYKIIFLLIFFISIDVSYANETDQYTKKIKYF